MAALSTMTIAATSRVLHDLNEAAQPHLLPIALPVHAPHQEHANHAVNRPPTPSLILAHAHSHLQVQVNREHACRC